MKGILESSVTEPQPDADQPTRQQGGTLVYAPFVRVMTIVIIALVVAMMALIYAKSSKIREPSTALVILGDQTHDGAKVEVKGYGQTFTAILTEDNRYATPVLLEPGQYTVKITHKNHVLLDSSFVVENSQGRQYTLPPAVEIIAPPSATHDVHLMLEGLGEDNSKFHEDLTLSAARGFQDTAYLSPGEYRATTNENGHVIARDMFTVQRYHPLTLKLGVSQQ